MHVVIDTNVLVVANARNCEQASQNCILACVFRLRQIQQEGIVVLDSKWQILNEYKKNVNSSGQPGVGDAFLGWVLTNLANPKHCETVDITPTETDNFAEFPQDPSLANFDPADRKFVAVALTHPTKPLVLEAVDSDWRENYQALHKFGVKVEFLCPEFAPRQL
jgi:hypothetical protein